MLQGTYLWFVCAVEVCELACGQEAPCVVQHCVQGPVPDCLGHNVLSIISTGQAQLLSNVLHTRRQTITQLQQARVHAHTPYSASLSSMQMALCTQYDTTTQHQCAMDASLNQVDWQQTQSGRL